MAKGNRICMHDDEIWIDARLIISIDQFIHEYQEEEFLENFFTRNDRARRIRSDPAG